MKKAGEINKEKEVRYTIKHVVRKAYFLSHCHFAKQFPAMKGGLMKRIGKVLLSSVLLFSSMNAVWAEEENEAVTEETEEVTEITEEETENEETVEEEVIEEAAEEEAEEAVEETEETVEETEETEEPAAEEEAELQAAGVNEKADLLNAARVSFVSNLYTKILSRTGSSKEISYYVSQLNGKMTAAKVVASFVESSEYQSKYPGDRAYVEDMYDTLLERKGSAKEVNYWVSCLSVGQTYRAVLAGMINSQEFKNVCAKQGIEAGTYTSPKAVDRNQVAPSFSNT